MRGTLLGILSETGPLIIRSFPGAHKLSSQDMALLGSLAVFADNLGLCLSQFCTSSTRVSLARFVPKTPRKHKPNGAQRVDRCVGAEVAAIYCTS